MDSVDETVGAAQVGAPGPAPAGGAVAGDNGAHARLAGDPGAGPFQPLPGELTKLPFSGELTNLKVNEIFGPTIQGEGPAAGKHCMFVRLAFCNLRCSWCDTAYTWAFTPDLADHLDGYRVYDELRNVRSLTTAQVIDWLRTLWNLDDRPTTIVISGGEPLMQQVALIDLCRTLVRMRCSVHIETAGTIAPLPDLADLVQLFVVSPKLAHSGNPEPKRIKAAVLDRFARMGHRAMFKFVAKSRADLDEVFHLAHTHGIPDCRIQIMPEGTTEQQILGRAHYLADEVVARGWGLSLRAHTLIWPNWNRGR